MHTVYFFFKLITTSNSDVNTILRHQNVYHYLEKHAPYLMDLIHKEDHEEQVVLVCKVSDMFSYFKPHLMNLFSDAGYYQPHPL